MAAQTHVFQDGYIVFRILVIRILNLFSPWDSTGRLTTEIRDTPQDALRRKYERRNTFYAKRTQFKNRQNINLTPYPENSYTSPQAPGFMPGVLPGIQTEDQFRRLYMEPLFRCFHFCADGFH